MKKFLENWSNWSIRRAKALCPVGGPTLESVVSVLPTTPGVVSHLDLYTAAAGTVLLREYSTVQHSSVLYRTLD